MVRKTVLRRNWKYLPKSAEMLDAQRVENRIDSGEAPQTVLLDLPEDTPGSAEDAERLAAEKVQRMVAERQPTATRVTQPRTTQPQGQPQPEEKSSPSGGEPPAQGSVDANGEQPPLEFTMPTFSHWDNLPDKEDPDLGLQIEVAGVVYVRNEPNQTWTAAAPKASTARERRPVNLPKRS